MQLNNYNDMRRLANYYSYLVVMCMAYGRLLDPRTRQQIFAKFKKLISFT